MRLFCGSLTRVLVPTLLSKEEWIPFKAAENILGPVWRPAVKQPEHLYSAGAAESAAHHLPPRAPPFTPESDTWPSGMTAPLPDGAGAEPSGFALVNVTAQPPVAGVCQQLLDNEVSH